MCEKGREPSLNKVGVGGGEGRRDVMTEVMGLEGITHGNKGWMEEDAKRWLSDET